MKFSLLALLGLAAFAIADGTPAHEDINPWSPGTTGSPVPQGGANPWNSNIPGGAVRPNNFGVNPNNFGVNPNNFGLNPNLNPNNRNFVPGQQFGNTFGNNNRGSQYGGAGKKRRRRRRRSNRGRGNSFYNHFEAQSEE